MRDSQLPKAAWLGTASANRTTRTDGAVFELGAPNSVTSRNTNAGLCRSFCPLAKDAMKLSRDVLVDQRTSLDQVSARECSIGRCGLMRICLVSLRKSPHRFPLAAFGDSAVHQAGEV